MKKGSVTIIATSLIGIIILGGCRETSRQSPPPLPKVVAAYPEKRAVLEYEDLPGRVQAIESVEVKARVTGFLTEIHFQEGAEVREGDLLYSIDPREFRAERDSAEAALQQAEARLSLVQSEFERAKHLSRNTVIAQQELESRGTAVLEAEAAVRAAQAVLARARLNLEYASIRAPVSGKISNTRVTVGNLVEDGDILTTIVSQDPVYVYFEVPERVILRWNQILNETKGQGITASTRAFVGLNNEEGFPREGRVDFVDNQVNPGTGTLRMRAVLPNGDRSLRAGLYARVRVSLDKPREALLVPERAVSIDQDQRYVYVIDPEGKAEYRRVTMGQLHDGMRVIRSGISADDRVITEGLLSVRPGVKVDASSPEPAHDETK